MRRPVDGSEWLALKTILKTHSVRLPEDLHRRLLEEAVKNDRSLNAELVRRLRLSLVKEQEAA